MQSPYIIVKISWNFTVLSANELLTTKDSSDTNFKSCALPSPYSYLQKKSLASLTERYTSSVKCEVLNNFEKQIAPNMYKMSILWL